MGSYQKFDIKSLFLGSQSENSELLKELVELTLNSIIETRIKVNQFDEPIFSKDHVKSEVYTNSKSLIIQKTNEMLEFLKESIQFSSFRTMSYMFGDTTIPSIIGNISTLFYNQTNLIYQLSNTTTPLEYIIIKDFIKLIGFENCNEREVCFNPKSEEKLIEFQEIQAMEDSINAFGHLTSGGSISNFEAFLSSYFNKFLAVSIRLVLLNEEQLYKSRNIMINTKYIYTSDYIESSCGDSEFIKIVSLSNWDLLNLDVDQVVRLPFQIANENKLKYYDVIELIKKYHPINTGIYRFIKENEINLPIFIVPKSAHYSFSKSSSLLGFGIDNGLKIVDSDLNNRMSISHLKEIIKECSINKIPVLNVTCVIGSTQESAVDPLDQVLDLRDKYRKKKKLNWSIHSDGAYGALFMTCIRDDFPMDGLPNKPSNSIINNGLGSLSDQLNENQFDYFQPQIIINDYLAKQFSCLKYSDTITIDPHKHGFVNFSTGGILFRNEKFKYILSMTTQYIGGFSIENLGTYGIEGSRCGQSAAAVFLTHSIIRPSKSGYGRLLSLSLLNSKLFYLGLLCLNEMNSCNFKIITLAKPPNRNKFNYLVERIFNISDLSKIDELVFPHLNDIIWDSELIQVLANIGSELNVICFTINSKSNSDYQYYIKYIDIIGKRFSILNAPNIDLLLSSTSFNESSNFSVINALIESIGLKTSIPSKNILIPFLRALTIDPFSTQTINTSVYTNVFKLLKNEINEIKEIN